MAGDCPFPQFLSVYTAECAADVGQLLRRLNPIVKNPIREQIKVGSAKPSPYISIVRWTQIIPTHRRGHNDEILIKPEPGTHPLEWEAAMDGGQGCG